MKKICILGFALLVGCATITKGTKQTVAITSNVDGATIFVDGTRIGTTPYNGTIPKNKKELRVEKEGYRSSTIVLSKTMEGMFWGNIIIGGTLGSSTDFASGAAYSYAPATYHVELKAESASLEDYRRILQVRKFAMLYIDEISQDLALGDGEHLQTLISYMGENQKATNLIPQIHTALKLVRGDQVKFGKAMVDLL